MEIVHTRNSEGLAKSLARELSLPVFPANVRRFGNGEISVSVSKSFHDVAVVSSTVTNDDWLELLLLLDALRSAKNIVLCMPYMGYSRQDVQNQNESLGARLFPRLLEITNVAHCIILDNHGEPMMHIPYTHTSADVIFEVDIMSKYTAGQMVVVSPDIGGAYRASALSRSLKCGFAICNKARDVFGELKKTETVGNISNKICVLVDDIVDSGATLCHAAEALLAAGGKGVVAYVVHGILSSGSRERLEKSPIEEIVLTDSICGPNVDSPKFRKLSVASLLAEAIGYIMRSF
ncbi:MAG: ribose-phosphate diphosphokinase [Holosporaceae bacterium]|jgi:ribose-phosphate pyrophosphokinase|nr:ribose-phosphate diphosphokinase [Holosporaceae bacterium]